MSARTDEAAHQSASSTPPDRSTPLRVVHLVSHPIQYFVPLYRVLAARPEIELEVFFYSDASFRTFANEEFGQDIRWDDDLATGYTYRLPPGSEKRPIPCTTRDGVRPDIFSAVMATDADVLWLHAYHWPTSLALAYAFLARKRAVVIRGEQTLLDGTPAARGSVKRVLMSPMIRRARCAYIGEHNRHYLATYGANASRLYFAPYSVPRPASQPDRQTARAYFSIDSDLPVVLFSGKLVDRKQPLMLLDAWRRSLDTGPSWLLFAGDGPLRPVIEEEIARLQLERVVIAGFLNQDELPMAYAAADIAVLPSKVRETWGLVVNEAFMAGVPAIVSAAVGSGGDLIVDGWNGYVVSPDDPAELGAKLAELVESPEQRRLWGTRSRHRVEQYSVDRTADGLVAAFCGDQSLAPTPASPAM